jgi:hypothetical protein
MPPIAHAELDQAYRDLRVQVVRVLQARQIYPRSGSAIAQSLGINRQLAWQVATIAAESSTPAGLTVMPGQRGLEMFVEASARQTAADPDVVELRGAIVRLEHVIRIHAGDRATLSLIAAAWDSAEVERRTEDLRRDAHRAQCALLGAKVATQVRGVIFAPSQRGDDQRVAMATYQGMTGVTRVRAHHRSRLFYLELPTHDDGTRDLSVRDLASHLAEKFQLEPALSSVDASAMEYLVDAHGAAFAGGQVGHVSRIPPAGTRWWRVALPVRGTTRSVVPRWSPPGSNPAASALPATSPPRSAPPTRLDPTGSAGHSCARSSGELFG